MTVVLEGELEDPPSIDLFLYRSFRLIDRAAEVAR